MESRRDILKKLAFGAAAAVVITPRRDDLRAFAARGSTDEAPWWLLRPLQEGSRLGRGWRIEGLDPVQKGACVLTLARTDGARARFHVCAHGGRPKGVAHSALLDLVLMDGRQGAAPTDEGLAQVAASVARQLRRNERGQQADLASLDRVLSHEERVAIYGPENLV